MPDDKKIKEKTEKPSFEGEHEAMPDNSLGGESHSFDSAKRHEIPVKIDRAAKADRSETMADSASARHNAPGVWPLAGLSGQARQKRIEAVLAKDLEEAYLKMPKNKQLEFKEKGEETAAKIDRLLSQGKATFKKIVELIRKWLVLLPGLNRFFLEQEAKLKADEIMGLKDISNL